MADHQHIRGAELLSDMFTRGAYSAIDRAGILSLWRRRDRTRRSGIVPLRGGVACLGEGHTPLLPKVGLAQTLFDVDVRVERSGCRFCGPLRTALWRGYNRRETQVTAVD